MNEEFDDPKRYYPIMVKPIAAGKDLSYYVVKHPGMLIAYYQAKRGDVPLTKPFADNVTDHIALLVERVNEVYREGRMRTSK